MGRRGPKPKATSKHHYSKAEREKRGILHFDLKKDPMGAEKAAIVAELTAPEWIGENSKKFYNLLLTDYVNVGGDFLKQIDTSMLAMLAESLASYVFYSNQHGELLAKYDDLIKTVRKIGKKMAADDSIDQDDMDNFMATVDSLKSVAAVITMFEKKKLDWHKQFIATCQKLGFTPKERVDLIATINASKTPEKEEDPALRWLNKLGGEKETKTA